MENRRLLLIGGGGHCKSVLDSLFALNIYKEIGIIDKPHSNISVLGVPQIGADIDLPDLYSQGWKDAFITVGSMGNTILRRKIYSTIKEIGYSVPSIVDKTSVVAADVQIPEGTYIGKRATINAGTKLGVCSIVNTGAIIEHDCIIGDFVHVSPGAVLCGQVNIGNDSHVGANSTVRQRLVIGKYSILGIGSVVTHDIADHVEAYGNPCKVVKVL